jgi:nitrate reductase gamma subunit
VENAEIAVPAGAGVTSERGRPSGWGDGRAGGRCVAADRAVFHLLGGIAGFCTLLGAGVIGEQHSYRETVSPWFRSLFVLQPDVTSMSHAGLGFQVHTLIGMLLFAIWPFTRPPGDFRPW